jgi:nucleoid-associated protein YgaU
VWLLVLPPASADRDGPPGSIADLVNTPTATATATPTPTEEPDSTATATPTPELTATPEATETPVTTPEQQTYVVQAGDTLFAIAERFAPSGTDATTFAQRIAEANNIADASTIQIGDELIIPAE